MADPPQRTVRAQVRRAPFGGRAPKRVGRAPAWLAGARIRAGAAAQARRRGRRRGDGADAVRGHLVDRRRYAEHAPAGGHAGIHAVVCHDGRHVRLAGRAVVSGRPVGRLPASRAGSCAPPRLYVICPRNVIR